MSTADFSLTYVARSTLPSIEASAVHVTHMCDAFAALGVPVRLRARPGTAASAEQVVAHYGLRQHFPIVLEGRRQRSLWLVGRALDPRRFFVAQDVYYGRDITSLLRLAQLGYAVGLELHLPPEKKGLQRVRKLVACRRFLGIVVISQQLREAVLTLLPELSPTAVLVAHDGVSAHLFRKPLLRHSARICAVYSGSLFPGKGIDALLAAAPLAPEIEFHVFGGTEAEVEAVAARAAPNVRLHGRIPHAEVAARLADSDIALAPYGRVVLGVRHKPGSPNLAQWMSPLKFFEYMAAGLPMVTSDLPVIAELLRHEHSALLVSPDDANALAAAIRRLAGDAELRLRLAQTAQAELGQYTWEHRARAIADFLSRSSQPRAASTQVKASGRT